MGAPSNMAREIVVALLIAVGCSNASRMTTCTPPPGENDGPPAFALEIKWPDSCRIASTCEATIQLTALGDYKVNKYYPFKFVADPGVGVTVEGPGTFAARDLKTGILTLTLRPTAAGTARVSGKFKLSVCTEEVCKIEAPVVTFE